MFAHGQPVTVIRTETGRHGDALPEPPEHTVEDCAWHQGASEEDDALTGDVTVDMTLYAPYGADIKAIDRIRLPDGEYDVIGRPARWQSPLSGWQAGTRILLKEG